MICPYITYLLPNIPIIPIILGHLNKTDIKEISLTLNSIIDDHTLIIVSSDFTHFGEKFGYRPFDSLDSQVISDKIKRIDSNAIQYILNNDLDGFTEYIETVQPTICGQCAIRVLLELCRDNQIESLWADYNQSGKISGDWLNTVSYAGIVFGSG